MPNTLYPSQIGFMPPSGGGRYYTSTIFLGGSTNSGFAGIGFGRNGQPDYAEVVQINLNQRVGQGNNFTLNQLGTITLNINDILSAMAENSNFPQNLNLTLKEVAVCDAGTEKRMMIIASQVYNK